VLPEAAENDGSLMPIWLEAGLWGLLGGSALLIGAAIAWLVPLPQRLVAAVMAAGSGVLISAVAFDLMDEAFARGGSTPRPPALSAVPRSTRWAMSCCRVAALAIASDPVSTARRCSRTPARAAARRSRSAHCWTASRNRS
jgi:hypothetical protein